MIRDLKNAFSDILWGSLLSYSQVFFSKSKIFSVFILIITFIHPYVGLSGFLCSFMALLFAWVFRFYRETIRNGYYGYNSLLVGLGLGAMYQFTYPLFFVLIFAGFLTLVIQTVFERILQKYSLPALSLPFVVSLWILLLAVRQGTWFPLSEHNVFFLNNIFELGGPIFLSFYECMNTHWLPTSLQYLFISFGSIFFQDNVLAGVITFIGLILFSRIAASLAILGFFSAFYFMMLIGIDINNISIFFVGFNFILTAIVLGGVFIIPSIYSYLWAVFITPVGVILTLGLSQILNTWQLSVLSLPFNLIVLFFLIALRTRSEGGRKLIETLVQEFMPEKNLYLNLNYRQKKGINFSNTHLFLPFWGEWMVWQGYNGAYTHKDLYQHALDFVVTHRGKTYKNSGIALDDYYTYNKLVCSPGNGIVVKIIDGLEDNAVGDVNTLHNWGNCIVIKHGEHLYTQLSHLKKGSFKVREGEFVKTGQPLAHVGNSGRSPEPHLHMQVQLYPTVGSPTIEYPISRYMIIKDNLKELRINQIPKENEHVENVNILSSLARTFHFIPGMNIEVVYQDGEKTSVHQWEVFTDSFNHTYIFSHTTKSYASVYKDDISFYFTNFSGKRTDPMYHFYVSCFHIEFVSMPINTYEEEFPLHLIFPFYKTFIQDIFAPFVRFMKARYRMKIGSIAPQAAAFQIVTEKEEWILNRRINYSKSNIYIEEQRISKIEIGKYTLNLTFKNQY